MPEFFRNVRIVDGDGNEVGSIVADLQRSSTATLSNVSDSDSNQTLLTANANREGVIIVNDSTATLYIKYGATASTSSFTYKVAPGATFEMPVPIFTGQLDGIWSSNASGAARITEMS